MLDLIKDLVLCNTEQNGTWYGKLYTLVWGYNEESGEFCYSLQKEDEVILSDNERGLLDRIAYLKQDIRNIRMLQYTEEAFKLINDAAIISSNINTAEEAVEAAEHILSKLAEKAATNLLLEADIIYRDIQTLSEEELNKKYDIYEAGDGSGFIIHTEDTDHSYDMGLLIEKQVRVYYDPDPSLYINIGTL